MVTGNCARFVVLLLALAAAPVLAQQYPVRAVRLIVASSPGAGVDIVARIMAQKVSTSLGQQVVVDNRAGAGANLGAEIAAKSPADGYTLLMGTPAHTINVSLYSGLNYDVVRDFAPVSLVSTGQYVVIVHPSVPARTAKELIAIAKARPGALAYGSAGPGNSTHLAGELFNSMAGIKMLHVPYRGSGPALIDLTSGQLQVMFANITAGLPFIRNQRVRGARRDRAKAHAAGAGSSHRGRGRAAGLLRDVVFRRAGANRYAGAHHRETQCRDRQGGAFHGSTFQSCQRRRRGNRQLPRGIRRLHPGRDTQVGGGREDGGAAGPGEVRQCGMRNAE